MSMVGPSTRFIDRGDASLTEQTGSFGRSSPVAVHYIRMRSWCSVWDALKRYEDRKLHGERCCLTSSLHLNDAVSPLYYME